MFYIYADGELLYNPLNENEILLTPRLTLEMGKAGSFSFGIPPTNYLYDRLRKLKTVITVEQDGETLFRGRILSEERGFNNIKSVYCEGDLAYLVDSVQKNEAYTGSAHQLFANILNKHNQMVEPYKQFKMGKITIEDRPIIISGQSDEIQDAETKNFNYRQIAINATVNEWKTTYDYIQESLINYCGGYLRTRMEADGVYLDYVAEYSGNASQEIAFGVNLLDLTEEISAEDLFTVLIPLGDDNLTIASVNGGSEELADENAVAEFGRIVRTHAFDSVTSPETLLENGRRYLQNHVNVPVTLTVTAVDMHLVDEGVRQILLGDRVVVNSAPHSIIRTLTCTRIEYDLENAANDQYTFGNPKQTLTERYRKDIQKTADAAQANAARGGGGAGGAAEESADDETQKKLDEWYEAYINLDKEHGHVSLGAVLKRIENGEEVLKRECGIDISAAQGNINIKTMRNDVDNNTLTGVKNSTRIDSVSNEIKSQITLQAAWNKYMEGVEDAHYAELKLIADENGTAINLKADKVNVESMETNINSKITNINSEITKVKKLIADEISALKVNTAWLNGIQLHASLVYANSVDTDGLKVGYVNCTGGMQIGTDTVATQEWVKARNYLTGLPDYCRASTFSASNSMYIGGNSVATQAWVRQQLADYAAKNHTHAYSFSKSIANGHTHTVTVNGRKYTTTGVSTNATHTISVSGRTD